MAKTKLPGGHGDHLVREDTKINYRRVKYLSKKEEFVFLKQSLILEVPLSPSEGHLFT